MKTRLLALTLAFMGFSIIGCGNDDKDAQMDAKQQSLAKSCMYDPSGQCQLRAKAMLEGAPVTPAAQAQLDQANITTNANGDLVSKTTGNKILPASVDAKTVQAQAAQVLADKSKIESNPLSSYYDPQNGTRAPASTADGTASATGSSTVAILPTSAADSASAVAPASVASSGGAAFK